MPVPRVLNESIDKNCGDHATAKIFLSQECQQQWTVNRDGVCTMKDKRAEEYLSAEVLLSWEADRKTWPQL